MSTIAVRNQYVTAHAAKKASLADRIKKYFAENRNEIAFSLASASGNATEAAALYKLIRK